MNREMYAVKFRFKNDVEWRYSNENVIVTEHETEKYNPEMYLCDTLKEARSVQLLMIQRYTNREDIWDDYQTLAAIKISKMNRYNLRRESEVLEYREWK